MCILGAELGNIAGTGQQRWNVSAMPHVESTVTGIMNLFEEVGLPILRRFSQLPTVLNVLRTDQKMARLIFPLVSAPLEEAEAIEQRASGVGI